MQGCTGKLEVKKKLCFFSFELVFYFKITLVVVGDFDEGNTAVSLLQKSGTLRLHIGNFFPGIKFFFSSSCLAKLNFCLLPSTVNLRSSFLIFFIWLTGSLLWRRFKFLDKISPEELPV